VRQRCPGTPRLSKGSLHAGLPDAPRQRRVLRGPAVLPVTPGEKQGGTSSTGWWVANPFPRRRGYFAYKSGVTSALAETKTCRRLISTLQIESKWDNSLG